MGIAHKFRQTCVVPLQNVGAATADVVSKAFNKFQTIKWTVKKNEKTNKNFPISFGQSDKKIV